MRNRKSLIKTILLGYITLAILVCQTDNIVSTFFTNVSGLYYVNGGLRHDQNFVDWVYTNDDRYSGLSIYALQAYENSEKWADISYQIIPSLSALLLPRSILACPERTFKGAQSA